jgi:GT2 family glycosyltransferase
LGEENVGAVAAGAIDDASGEIGYPVTWRDGIATTEEVIQTGTLWSVAALSAIGGFDEALGIDAVDAAACLALRRAGLGIVLAPDVRLVHRIGSGRQVRILGRDVLASGHSPERRASILRNRLRLFPAEFAQSPRHGLRTLRRVTVQTALAVTIEEDRWAKAKASVRGLLTRRSE